MPVLTLVHNGTSRRIPFSGEQPLHRVLRSAGVMTDHPCGGKGRCGKCAVTLAGCISEPNEAELAAGTRLSCQAVLLGDATVWLPDTASLEQIELGSSAAAVAPVAGRYGAAVDIGTTTIALSLCRLPDGAILASCGGENPQRTIAADVIGRMEAAMSGNLSGLQEMVLSAIQGLLTKACRSTKIPEEQVDALVITGNTTMLYLLTGRDPEPLSHAPFRADCLFGFETTVLGKSAYLSPCMDAFVGADITCAVLASGITERMDTALLCDIGTNGEIALWKDKKLSVTSTAAGPAFEGAGISCGCGSIRGAIDRVWLENGEVRCHTIGEIPPVGLCGSGLIDGICVFLKTGDIDETGAVEADALPLSGNIQLLPKDIRAVQLAKAAIAAGIQTVLETTGTAESEVAYFIICGGFGSHLNLESAAAIGLIPEALAGKAQVAGNAALSGALRLLLDVNSRKLAERIAAAAVQLNLGGNPKFNENYIEQMFFPEEVI